jgi:hypothetical protein
MSHRIARIRLRRPVRPARIQNPVVGLAIGATLALLLAFAIYGPRVAFVVAGVAFGLLALSVLAAGLILNATDTAARDERPIR